MLSKLGISFPINLRREIHESVAFPNELDCKQALFTPFRTLAGHTLQIRLKYCLSFKTLRSLLSQVTCFLAPISSNMKLLAYFHLHTNTIFNSHLKEALSCHQNPVSLSELQASVESVKAIIKAIFEGKCEYREITMSGKLNLNKDVMRDMQTLAYCPFFCAERFDVVTAISDLLLLLRIVKEMDVLSEVFVQFELQECLNDPSFQRLTVEATKLCSEEKRQELTTNNSTGILQCIVSIICPNISAGGSFQKCCDTVLSTFQSVSESAEFYQFLKEYKFIGRDGYLNFQTQFALVRDMLQAEDYNENVLHHLFMAFKYLSPFLEPCQTFSSLMTSVSELEPEHGIFYLKTVRENIHMIQRWFSRSEV